ncbi:uncharacterized protein LOC118439005 [Folsomia candida]|uniref:uncharacterized protein LOC118439005 n=1 Tax=Folsomia candida TaxID=158441 RepID=UPI001604ED86|nr:uncharacterized protein LOC118439005 [Folsomia candida]
MNHHFCWVPSFHHFHSFTEHDDTNSDQVMAQERSGQVSDRGDDGADRHRRYLSIVGRRGQLVAAFSHLRQVLLCPFEIRRTENDSRFQMVTWAGGQTVASYIFLFSSTLAFLMNAGSRIISTRKTGSGSWWELAWIIYNVAAILLIVQFVYSMTFGRRKWLEMLQRADELAESLRDHVD